MFKTVRFNFYTLFRIPLWPSIFLICLIVSLLLPRANLVSMEVLPGMVFFVMAATLLFSLYGAEEARYEQKNYQIELLSTTPKYVSYLYGKLLFWLALSFSFYIIFYLEVLIYIHLVHDNVTFEQIQSSLIYTLLCWFIPMFLSVIIGYSYYSVVSSLYSYVGIVLIWFLMMPYNTLAGFLPVPIAGWLVIGDPNIQEIFGLYDMESQKVNIGFYVQRAFMLLLLMCLFIGIKSMSRMVRRVSIVGVFTALLIPVFSPYVPYITSPNPILPMSISQVPPQQLNYKIEDYTFDVTHGKSNHTLSYSVEMKLHTQSDTVSLALQDDFKIQSAMFNNSSIAFTHQNNIVTMKLPSVEGVLYFEVKTESSAYVGPTFFELLPTIPWYPMHPEEAVNPYHHGKKENYHVTVNSIDNSKLITNMQLESNDQWKGQHYGPTLLYGDYIRDGGLVRPQFKHPSQIQLGIDRLNKTVLNINKTLDENVQLSSQIYIVTTMQQISANPEQSFLYHDENMIQNESVLQSLYLVPDKGIGDTDLFVVFYYDYITNHSALRDHYRRQYGDDFMDKVESAYLGVSEQEKREQVKKWYKKTKGNLTPETVMEDL